MLAGDVPERSTVTRRRRRATTSICAAARRPACFSISARTARPRPRYARGRMLDCFSYNGGFALRARRAQCRRDDRHRRLRGRRGAHPRRTRARNGVATSTRASATCSTSCAGSSAPASASTRSCSTRRRSPRTRPRSPRRCAGYKEINLRALKLLHPGGFLVTCSCSYNVSEAAFAEIVYDAAVDARAVTGRREADAGARSSGAARRAGDLLPEVLHPAEAGVIEVRGRASARSLCPSPKPDSEFSLASLLRSFQSCAPSFLLHSLVSPR